MRVLMLLECCDCGKKVIGVVEPGVEDHIFVYQVGKDEQGHVWVHTPYEHWQRAVSKRGLTEICQQCREQRLEKTRGRG
jgi:hypothetical protein